MSLIKSRNEILHDIYTELSIYAELSIQTKFNINDNIYVVPFRESKDHIFMPLYNFLCENYYTNQQFRWRYPPLLFKYFLENSVVVIYYTTDKTGDKIICGMVIGKPIDIMYRSKFNFPMVTKSLDVNFLCVKRDLRKTGICKFLKYVLIKTTIENDDSINSALFTIGSDKGYNMYSQKRYYSKLIKNNQYNNLNLNSQLISLGLKINVFTSIELPDDILTNIKNYIYDDNIKKYDIFQIFDKEEITKIMLNSEFLKIFIMREQEIVGLVILYHLDFEENEKLFTNVFVYNYFIKGDLITLDFLCNCMEEVCKNMNIDVITSTTELDNTYLDTKINLKYYDFNLGLKNTCKNGLVTI